MCLYLSSGGKVVTCIVYVRNTQATSKLYSSTDESNMDAILLAQYAISHRPAVRSLAKYRSAIHVEIIQQHRRC